MNQVINKPYYTSEPICSLNALAKALNTSERKLVKLAQRADKLFVNSKTAPEKLDGSKRETYNVLQPLKDIHRRIKDQILRKVSYPYYLTGSLPERSYRINAGFHSGSAIVICEDVKSFFPSTTDKIVYNIWRGFFGFSEDVANILTKLCTRKGRLPQGAITSSYLANLVFWEYESVLFDKLKAQNMMYSRYVDDITVSSKEALSNEKKTEVISQVYGMLLKHGYKTKRQKHEIFTNNKRMVVNNLNVNRKNTPSYPRINQKRLRAAIDLLEQKHDVGIENTVILKELNKLASQVGVLGILNPCSAQKLKSRIKKIRVSITSD